MREGDVEPVTFSYIGTHYYRVSEVAGGIPGVTYDATHAYFRVVVTDNDMDGKAEIADVIAANNTTVDKIYDTTDPTKLVGYDIKAAFTNRYNSTTANINIHKNLTNNTGVDVPMDGFSFVFCTDAACTGDSTCTAAASHVTVKPNINGDVIIPLTYVKDDVTGTATVTTTYADLDASVPYVETTDVEATRTGTVKATETSVKTITETYYLKEVSGSMAGMVYDSKIIPVEVTVTATETVEYDVTKVINYTRSKLPVYLQQTDGEGNLVFDGEGNPVYVQQTDINGDPVVDGEGNPVYVQQTDTGGNLVWTYTEWVQNGEPTVSGTKPSPLTPVVTLESTVKYNNDAALTAAQFDNTYTLDPVKAVISGEKTYNRDIEAGQFTFNLYETDSTFTVASGAAVKGTATVDATAAAGGTATDAFSFDEITYDKAGTYYYVVKEALPAEAAAQNSYTVNGITYDTAVYHVTVTVSRNTAAGHEDELVASTTVHQVGGSGTAIAFTNSYSITSGTTAEIGIYKALDGRALNKDEFTFYLYEKADYNTNGTAATVLQTAKNSAYNTVNGNKYTGTVSFEAIPYTVPGTYEYAIVEDTSVAIGGVTYDTTPYVYATVVVKDNGDGTLAVDSITYDNASATIENTYTTTAVTATITGKKLYSDNTTNAAKTENETFTFALYEADENYNPQSVSCEEIQVTSNTGKFNFTLSRNFTKAGDYYFVLRELTGTNPTIAYDTRVYNVSVIVRDNGVGNLTANTRIFLNGTDVTGPDASNSFNTEYAFTNIYYPQEAPASVHVTKTVENATGVQLDKDGFRFGLYENLNDAKAKNDNYIATDLTDAEGNAYIGLMFKDTDVPNHIQAEKTYYLVEMYADRNDDFTPDVIGGMEYDQAIHQVSVVVKYVSGVLQAEVTGIQKLDSSDLPTGSLLSKAEYTNIYNLTEAKFSITAEKVLTGRNLADGEFRFALYNATVNSQGMWEKGAQIGGTTGNVGNAVTFKEQTYSRIGEYYYIAEEVIPADSAKLKGVEYDAAQFRITVTVTDNGAGALVAEVTDITEVNGTTETAVDKVVFNNTFTPDPIELSISGEKKLNNRAPLAGEFEFAIYAADEYYNITGAALATTTNAADGTFTFTNAMVGGDLLKFTDSATRKFVVKEVVPSPKDPTITYSTFEHNVEVKVTKRADGQLIYSVTDATGASIDLVIENTYTPKSATAKISLEKTLVNETGFDAGVSVKDFTFGLYTNEACTVPYTRNGNHVTVSPDDNGNFDSAVINIPYTDASYNAATTYTYYLKEIIPAAANRVPMMKYDNSVYKVVVTLSYDADNKLVATPVITKVRDTNGAVIATPPVVTTASFSNVYDLGTASISLEGTKVYEGWTNGTNDSAEFTIELYQTGVSGNYAATGSQLIASAVVKKTAPKATFTSSTVPQLQFTKAGTYYFAVRENKGGLTLVEGGHGIIYSGTQYVVAVKVSENVVNGKVTGLKAEKVVYHYGNKPEGLDDAASFEGFASDNIRFTNIDLDGKATIDFIGKKMIKNADMADYDQAFDFVLYEATVDGSNWTLVDSKPDTAAVDPLLSIENREKAAQQENDGYNVEFIGVPLEYEGDGSHTYHFVVKELNGTHPTIDYDVETEYKITVTAAFTTTAGTHNYIVTSVVVNGKNVSFTTVGEKTVVLLKNGSEYAFENEYTPFDTKQTDTGATFTVEKDIVNSTGHPVTETFEFALYEEDGVTPVKVDANGFVTDSGSDAVVEITGEGQKTVTLHYTDKQASVTPYVYYLKENKGATPGMTYSGQVYRIEVTVAFDTTGATPKLVATAVIHTVDPVTGIASHLVVNRAEFENVYALKPVTLAGFTGKKVIDARVISSYEYRFELYEAALTVPGNTVVTDANGAWVKGDRIEEVANTAQSGANAKDYDVFTFSDLTFDKVGVYHYILVEQKGANSSIIYDKNAYQITVTVAPHATKDELEATVTKVERVQYSYDTGYLDSEMVFEGIFGADSYGNVFTKDNFVFTNIYRPLGTFTVGGEKKIENRDWKAGDSFTFEIYYADENGTLIDAYKLQSGVNPMLSETVSYNAAGEYSFSFEDVIVSYIGVDSNKNAQIGRQYFVIKEKAENTLPSMSYDETVYLIQVDKKDNGDGTLAVGKYDGTTFTENEFVVKKLDGAGNPVLGPTDPIAFVNKYNTEVVVPATAVITGKKSLSNADINDFDKEFTFELYETDSSWAYSASDLIATALNDKAEFAFDNKDYMTFDTAGTYYYVIKERKGDNPAVKYSEQIFYVEIEVADTGDTDGDGKAELVAGTPVIRNLGVTEINFRNSYNPAPFTININKTIEFRNGASHPLNGFVFEVYDVERDKVYNPTTDAAGKTYFSCTFTEKDLGAGNSPKVYTYRVKEVYTGIDGMKYDKSKYEIQVKVYADNGFIRTEVTQQGTNLGLVSSTEVNFLNKYSGPEVPTNPDPGKPVIVPNTGDTTDNMLYLSLMAISAALAVAIFFIIKKRKDEEQTEA